VKTPHYMKRSRTGQTVTHRPTMAMGLFVSFGTGRAHRSLPAPQRSCTCKALRTERQQQLRSTPHSGYHYDGRTGRFFEGWYFKACSLEGRLGLLLMLSRTSVIAWHLQGLTWHLIKQRSACR